jgi:hypothetical protein
LPDCPSADGWEVDEEGEGVEAGVPASIIMEESVWACAPRGSDINAATSVRRKRCFSEVFMEGMVAGLLVMVISRISLGNAY